MFFYQLPRDGTVLRTGPSVSDEKVKKEIDTWIYLDIHIWKMCVCVHHQVLNHVRIC